jgi:hypothetical protein
MTPEIYIINPQLPASYAFDKAYETVYKDGAQYATFFKGKFVAYNYDKRSSSAYGELQKLVDDELNALIQRKLPTYLRPLWPNMEFLLGTCYLVKDNMIVAGFNSSIGEYSVLPVTGSGPLHTCPWINNILCCPWSAEKIEKELNHVLPSVKTQYICPPEKDIKEQKPEPQTRKDFPNFYLAHRAHKIADFLPSAKNAESFRFIATTNCMEPLEYMLLHNGTIVASLTKDGLSPITPLPEEIKTIEGYPAKSLTTDELSTLVSNLHTNEQDLCEVLGCSNLRLFKGNSLCLPHCACFLCGQTQYTTLQPENMRVICEDCEWYIEIHQSMFELIFERVNGNSLGAILEEFTNLNEGNQSPLKPYSWKDKTIWARSKYDAIRQVMPFVETEEEPSCAKVYDILSKGQKVFTLKPTLNQDKQDKNPKDVYAYHPYIKERRLWGDLEMKYALLVSYAGEPVPLALQSKFLCAKP